MPLGDQWSDEPNEPDPGEKWGDPERDLPNVPEAPEPPDPSGNEVPTDVAVAFWAVVVLVNLGLFAVSLGPMLIVFRGQWTLGGGLVVFGLLAFLHAYQRYRAFRNRDRDEETAAEPEEGAGTEGDTGREDDAERTESSAGRTD